MSRSLLAASLLAALGPTTFAGECPPGQQEPYAAPGHCCWPYQSFSFEAGRCKGYPECPPGYSAVNEWCQPTGSGDALKIEPSPSRAKRRALDPLFAFGLPITIGSYVAAVASVFVSITCDVRVAGVAGLVFIFPDCRSYSGWLFIPFAGPWIALGDNAGKPNTLPGEIAFYVVDGILQNLSYAAMFVGLTVTTEVGPGKRLTLLPAGPGGAGLTLVGAFE